MPIAIDLIIKGMSDAVLVLDVQGRILEANPVFRDLAGLDGAGVAGEPIAQVWPMWSGCAMGMGGTA